jgi:DNA-binding PadR family transcriptional regulator
LSPQVFQVLLSLAQAPQHGYSIILDVRDRTGGEIELTASTLYDALARLVDRELIEEVESVGKTDSRRRYYQLTRLGREATHGEIQRLERLLRTARATLTPRKGSAR